MDRATLLATTQMSSASEFQIDIFAYLAEQIARYETKQTTHSLIVGAVAGSGKTTTVVAAARLVPQKLSTMFLAFNKDIVTELSSRLPRHINTKTLNALGHGIWSNYVRGASRANVELKSFKTNDIMRKEYDRETIKKYGEEVRFLVAMCKSLGITPEGIKDVEPINGQYATDETLFKIGRHFSRFVPTFDRPTIYNMVRTVLTRGLAMETVIDFDDQKYMTVVKRSNGSRLPAIKYDVIIVDEAQDLNAVDHALIKMIRKDNGIVIGVGDERQAIYGFRGADTRAIANFIEEFNAETLPLSITYRCGKALVAHAQELVPTIQAAPTAIEGEVKTLGVVEPTLFQPKDMIICRNNAPLIRYAYKLIAAKVPCVVKGRDIGKGLIKLIGNWVGTDVWATDPQTGKKSKTVSLENAKVVDLVRELNAWAEQQRTIILQENEDDQEALQGIEDITGSIRVFIDSNTDGKVTSVVKEIEALFEGENRSDANKVILSSVHKSKGLEADNVYMLDAHLFYPKWLKQDSWQWDQETNLEYVARTRGKKGYYYIVGDEK